MPDAQRTLAALALAALLAGCAAGPAATQRPVLDAGSFPQLAPPATVAAQPQPAIDRWWTAFGDPALDALVDAALVRNADLAIAAARAREARARLDEVRGSAAPSVELQADAGRARASRDGGMPAGANPTSGQHRAALAGRYEVDLWGRIAAGGDAAQARFAASEWARAGVEWSLTAQLAEAHFSLRAVQRQLEIAAAVRQGRAALRQARARELAAGGASEFDLRRAEAELAGSEASIAALQCQRIALERTVALLAGAPLAELPAVEDARVALDPAAPFTARLPAGNAAELLLRRPDIREAEAELAAADADIAAARAATLPSLTLSGMVGSDVRSLSNLFNAPGFVWSVANSVSQTVFDGGQKAARVRQADARAEQAAERHRQVVASAWLELREAYAALDIDARAEQAERERVAALERTRRLAAAGVAGGALAPLDLLDAERASFDAQLAEVSARRDRLIGQVAVFKALGGGHRGA